MYQHLKQSWQAPKEELRNLWHQRIIQWRREPTTIRLERPTRLDRARSLGYKAKPGFVVIRQRVNRGGRQKPQIRHPRRPKAMSRRKDLTMSYQAVAENRAVQKYPNCEVLNSYYVGEDGISKWFEVIMADRTHPSVINNPNYSWLQDARARGFRGITSAGRKLRGLRIKGKGLPHFRSSDSGDLMIKVNVKTPENLKERQKALFEELRKYE